MSWLNRLERRLEPLAVPHVVLAIVTGQTFFYLAEMFRIVERDRLVLVWELVRQGEWWRVLSFVLVPPDAHWVFIAFALYLLYFLGTALEEVWGTLRLNLFLLSGWLLTVAAAALAPRAVAGNGFVGVSLFLAFAYLNPNYTFHLFLILPVRVKWLAWLTWAGYALVFATGGMAARLMVLAAAGNFLLFFGRRMIEDLRRWRREAGQAAVRSVARREAEASGPRHRCVVCGKDSDAFPDEDFRYRSDDNCYCEQHRSGPLVAELKKD